MINADYENANNALGVPADGKKPKLGLPSQAPPSSISVAQIQSFIREGDNLQRNSKTGIIQDNEIRMNAEKISGSHNLA